MAMAVAMAGRLNTEIRDQEKSISRSLISGWEGWRGALISCLSQLSNLESRISASLLNKKYRIPIHLLGTALEHLQGIADAVRGGEQVHGQTLW